jgi:hypothetical protein
LALCWKSWLSIWGTCSAQLLTFEDTRFANILLLRGACVRPGTIHHTHTGTFMYTIHTSCICSILVVVYCHFKLKNSNQDADRHPSSNLRARSNSFHPSLRCNNTNPPPIYLCPSPKEASCHSWHDLNPTVLLPPPPPHPCFLQYFPAARPNPFHPSGRSSSTCPRLP